MAIGPYYIGDIPSQGVRIELNRTGGIEDFEIFETALLQVRDPLGVLIHETSVELIGDQVVLVWPDTSPFALAGIYTITPILIGLAGYRETGTVIEFSVVTEATSVGVEALRSYTNAGNMDDAFLQSCHYTAVSMVRGLIGSTSVPETIVTRAILETGSELFARRNAPMAIAQYASPDGGQAIRVSRDPLVGARAILAPYLFAGGIG